LKHLGRVDINFRWDKIKAQWLSDYRSMAEIPGRCVKRRVTIKDEWCAEAYLETDYSTLTADEFTQELKRYAIFKLTHDGVKVAGEEAHEEAD
jgi:hypothetical protein